MTICNRSIIRVAHRLLITPTQKRELVKSHKNATPLFDKSWRNFPMSNYKKIHFVEEYLRSEPIQCRSIYPPDAEWEDIPPFSDLTDIFRLMSETKEYRLKPKKESRLPNGSYPALAGGYVSTFKIGDRKFEAIFTKGVRGIDVSDTVLVNDGNVFSQVLGKAKEIKEFIVL